MGWSIDTLRGLEQKRVIIWLWVSSFDLYMYVNYINTHFKIIDKLFNLRKLIKNNNYY
jgi:hypothetical protein